MGKLKLIRYFCMSLVMVIGLMTIVASGGGGGDDDGGGDPGCTDFETFSCRNGNICMEDGKPVIRLFSTTWCPHCQWISDTFDEVAQTYVDQGLIVAYHWELDTGDNTLTPQVEDSVPDSELSVYDTFNPQNTVPTFVFGCRYYRIGTGYENTNDLEAEKAEFIDVIEELLNSI